MSLKLFECIRKFSPSVIYSFEPERSSAQLFYGSTKLEDTFMYQYMQTQDLIHAYLYAQETMLPEMVAHFQGRLLLSPERLLTHIKELHRLACQQMLEDKTFLGVYHVVPTFRWHYGAILNGEMLAYFSGLHEAKTANEFSLYLNKYFEVPVALTRDFIDLLESLNHDTTLESDPYFLAFDTGIEAEYYPGFCTLMKLNLAYHAADKLSRVQRELVENMVLPCLPPESLPLEMEKYATSLLTHIQHLDMDDRAQLSHFLAETFYQLTSLHPFVNGNGRVAICFLNLLLVAMDLPSIVIRMPGDAQNPKSDYVRAFLEIDHSRELLSRLIESKLSEAEDSPSLDQANYDLCCLRLNVLQALQDLQKISYSINDLFLLGRLPLFISPEFCRGRSHEELEKLQLIELLFQAKQLLQPSSLLQKFSITASARDDVAEAMPRPLSEKKIVELKQFLQDLSDLSGWKYNYKAGDCFWLKVENLVQGYMLKHALTMAIPSLRTQLSKVKGEEHYVIQCRGIDLFKHFASLPKEKIGHLLHP